MNLFHGKLGQSCETDFGGGRRVDWPIRHLEAVKAHPECSLVGLADPNMSLDVDAPRFASMAEVDRVEWMG